MHHQLEQEEAGPRSLPPIFELRGRSRPATASLLMTQGTCGSRPQAGNGTRADLHPRKTHEGSGRVCHSDARLGLSDPDLARILDEAFSISESNSLRSL